MATQASQIRDYDKSKGVQAPYVGAEAIVVATPFSNTCSAIYVGGAGNITATMQTGESVTFTAVPVGSILPIRATNVTAATATLMIALF